MAKTPAFGLQSGDQAGELVLAHRADFDMGDERAVRIGCHRFGDLADDGIAQRTILDGEFDVDGHIDAAVSALGGVDARDHAKIGDRSTQFRVDHPVKAFEDIGFDVLRIGHDPP